MANVYTSSYTGEQVDAAVAGVNNLINGSTPAAKATADANGANIASTYAKQNGTYSGMSVGKATSAITAISATNANQLGGIAAASYAQLSQVVPNNIYVMSTAAITVDWDNVNWSDFDSVFGSGWRNRVGTYLCRINTTGNISQFGFSASYYCQIQVWYAVGGSSYALIVISDEAGNKYNGTYLYANTSIADSKTQVNFYKNFAIDPTINFVTGSVDGIEGWIQLTFASDLSTLEKGVYLVSISDDMPNPVIVFWDPAHTVNYYQNWFTVTRVSNSSRIGFQLINIDWNWVTKQINSLILYFNGSNWVSGGSLPSSTALSLYKIL